MPVPMHNPLCFLISTGVTAEWACRKYAHTNAGQLWMLRVYIRHVKQRDEGLVCSRLDKDLDRATGVGDVGEPLQY